MKRFLACVVSLSLLVVTPAPAAWAQLAQAVGRGPAATALPGVQSGAVRFGGPVQITNAAALVAPLSGSSAFAAAPAALPGAAPASAVSATLVTAAQPAASAVNAAKRVTPTSVAAAVPVSPVAGAPIVAAQGQLSETGKALAAPAAKAESSLERLFTGALRRAALEAEPIAALPSRAAASSGLERAPGHGILVDPGFSAVPSGTPNAPQGSKVVGALKAIGLFALGAGAAVGLQMGAVALAPALFALVPVAAVWAVSGGILLFPAALYARYRLSLRDSPRLNKVKTVMDLALGAYAGALFVAAPSLLVVLSGAGLLASALPAAGLLAGLAVRGSPFLDSVMVWGALGLAPLAVAAAATGGLALAPILGLLALPVMTTISFFLGRLIYSAESGAPFSVPGSLQKIRFPAFQWVMTGVVFALLTGYTAVYTTPAFIAWNILGMRSPAAWDKTKPLWKNVLNKAASFDVVYLGLFAFAAVTGFTSPLTFLVIAFSGERAAVWTEKLMTRFLPRAKPAASTSSTPASDPSADAKPSRWPRFHYWAKSGALLGAMAGVGVIMGLTVFGFTSLLKSAIPAVLLAFVPFFFAHKIIKAVMKSKPADEAADPEFFSIMRELRERLNVERRAKGKKEIPMPELVIDPLPAPNAYATGRSPFKALVGVTVVMKEMTLDAESVRAGVARLVSSVPADSKAFRVFRLGVAGSISGVSPDATPAEVQSAVLKADHAELKALGVRMLRGVLGHEFSHVMDRHMLSGSIAGAISSSIAFASYGMMWAVTRVQTAIKKAFDAVLGRSSGDKKMVEPISVGVAAKSLGALLKLFAALWVPVIVQIVQMASSRNNEGMADEDGALLTGDPESLALGLGLLTTWRPKPGFVLPANALPRLAALSHLMTVNPLRQVQEAGVMPELDAVTAAVVGKGDDFLFNLFITHPDTMVRIAKLADMAEALRAAKNGGVSGEPSTRLQSAAQASADPIFDQLMKKNRTIFNWMMAAPIFSGVAAIAALSFAVLSMPVPAVLSAGSALVALVGFLGPLKSAYSRSHKEIQDHIFNRLTPASRDAQPGPIVTAVLKLLDAIGAILSIPRRIVSGLTQFVAKATGLSPQVSALAQAVVALGAAAAVILLHGPIIVGAALLLMGGLFTAYGEAMLDVATRRRAAARLSSEVDAHRAEILSIPGVVAVSAVSGSRLYVQVQVTRLDAGNVDLIPKTLGGFPVEVSIAKAPDAK